ncbi:hypothetical protein AGABI1DRAFT_69614 [Agaricus bisporus var. burnettii JB137-S8]|uniref:pyranose dehydrogenase (acceptor) n=1 Tax=Agaricus bisporus var. burnettii (strain JB137-S8 / ATCC MYA-4627 / FGSC 10392) TaxID=597362 RepID=K5XJ05_AGABU|nr:uncharacterized protein AGABI1DRAFT_69614 [Agaricus bisporus var. burnettii JB137-S8]EKM83317.1 hypothetical protein AGABI1DRAFT_69614 [Agaricus bisporus var. burnettii JB137-S8]
MTLHYLRSLAFLLICCQLVPGAILFNSPDDLPQDVEYDFVVIGGGTAGNVVATRLAENPEWNILVIEAGPSNEEIFATRPPGIFHDLLKTRVDWNFTTVNQPGLNGRNQSYARGKMLGGCSSHNGMVYTTGSRDDWDRWAKVTDAEELSWDNILPLIRRAERFVLKDSENQDETGHVDPSLHGHTGNLTVTAPYVAHPFDDLLIKTTTELTDEFPYKQDMNDGRPIGISWNQFTIDEHAERSTSATAYLARTGGNVHTLINTFVKRVLPIGNGLDFRKVEFMDAQGSSRKVVAQKEVILSGGIFGTPQVLLNSGIGLREELATAGIKTLVNNPSVGKNFTDHVAVLVVLPTTLPDTDFDRDQALAQWNHNRTGRLIIPNHLNNLIWVRLADDAVPFGEGAFIDPTGGGKNSPHVEFSFSQISIHPPKTTVDIPDLPPDSNTTTVQMTAVNLHPVSRGSMSLNSTNPFGPPLIDLGILTEDVDVAILREGIRSLRRLYSSPSFRDSVSDTVLPAANVTTDEDLDAFIRSVASPWLHGIGTAAMSPRGADWGVVDPNFQVKGTEGLRIVDASIFPDLPSGHTQAPTYGIAELASSMIAEAWND